MSFYGERATKWNKMAGETNAIFNARDADRQEAFYNQQKYFSAYAVLFATCTTFPTGPQRGEQTNFRIAFFRFNGRQLK